MTTTELTQQPLMNSQLLCCEALQDQFIHMWYFLVVFETKKKKKKRCLTHFDLVGPCSASFYPVQARPDWSRLYVQSNLSRKTTQGTGLKWSYKTSCLLPEWENNICYIHGTLLCCHIRQVVSLRRWSLTYLMQLTLIASVNCFDPSSGHCEISNRHCEVSGDCR